MPEEIIDLTQVMENDMPVFPGSRPVGFLTCASFEKDGYHETSIDCSTHTGTHIDCGFHLLKGGTDTLTTPLNRFYGRGMVIDCREIRNDNSISKEFLVSREGHIRKADFILLLTGWSQHWGTTTYFTNFPVLDEEAATYLSSFSLKGLGCDAISFDPMASATLPVHHMALAKGMILVENMTNLDRLPGNGFIFACFPLKIKNGDGSPVRAVAIIAN